jgi:hypothetical protein
MRDRKSLPIVVQELFGADILVLPSGATADDIRQLESPKIVHDEYTWI